MHYFCFCSVSYLNALVLPCFMLHIGFILLRIVKNTLFTLHNVKRVNNPSVFFVIWACSTSALFRR